MKNVDRLHPSGADNQKSGWGNDRENDGCCGLTDGKTLAAEPTDSCKSLAKPLPPTDWPGPAGHDQHRITCLVMPIPPHSGVNRHQNEKSGCAAALGPPNE